MAGEFREEPLSKLCSYLNRGAAPSYVDTGGLLVLNQKCVRDQRVNFSEARRTDHERKPVADQRMLRALDILVNSTGVGTLGRVAQVRALPEPATIDSHVTVLRPDSEAVEPLYLGLAVRCFEADIEALGEGSTGQTELSRDRLGAFSVPIPSRPEQRAIARILGTLDDKIELNRRMSETLEAMAQALFKSWFVDFAPVRAKAEGRDPGLPQPLADLFPDRLVGSELGEIPQGWAETRVGDHVHCVKGKSYKSEHLQDSDTALVTLKSFARGGGYRPGGLKAYTGDYKPEQAVRPGELVVACTDVTQAAEVIGKAALVQPNDQFDKLVASLDVLIVRPNDGAVTVPFLYCLFRTDEFSEHTYAHTTGTTVLHLDKDAVPSFQFTLPPSEVVRAFSQVAGELFQRADEAERESRTLAAIRDSLLPKLVSGQVRVAGRQVNKYMREHT